MANKINLYRNFLTKVASGSLFDPYSWMDHRSPFGRGSVIDVPERSSKSAESRRDRTSDYAYGDDTKSETKSDDSDTGPTSLLGDSEDTDIIDTPRPRSSKGKRYVYMPMGMPMGGMHINIPGGPNISLPMGMMGGGMPMMGMTMMRRPGRDFDDESGSPIAPSGRSKTEIKRLASGAEVMLVRDGSGRVIDVLDLGTKGSTPTSGSEEEDTGSSRRYTEEDLAARKAAIDAAAADSSKANKAIRSAIDAREANAREWNRHRLFRLAGLTAGGAGGYMIGNWVKSRLGLDNPADRTWGGWWARKGIDAAGILGGSLVANAAMRYIPGLHPKDLSKAEIK